MSKDSDDFDWTSRLITSDRDNLMTDNNKNSATIVIPRKDDSDVDGCVQYYTTTIDENGNAVSNSYVYESFSFGPSNKPGKLNGNKKISSTSIKKYCRPLNSASYDYRNINKLPKQQADKQQKKQVHEKNNFISKKDELISTKKNKPKSNGKTSDLDLIETSLIRPYVWSDFDFDDDVHIDKSYNNYKNKKGKPESEVKIITQTPNKKNQLYSDRSASSNWNVFDDTFNFETIDSDLMHFDETIKTNNYVDKSKPNKKSSEKIKDKENSRRKSSSSKRTDDDEHHHIHFGKKFKDIEVKSERDESKKETEVDDLNTAYLNFNIGVFDEKPSVKQEEIKNRGKNIYLNANAKHLPNANIKANDNSHKVKGVKIPYDNEYKNHPERKSYSHKNNHRNNYEASYSDLSNDGMFSFDEIQPLTTPFPPTLSSPQHAAIMAPVLKKPNISHSKSSSAGGPEHINSFSPELNRPDETSDSTSTLDDLMNKIKDLFRF